MANPILKFNVNKISALPDLSEGATHIDLAEVKRYLISFGYLPRNAAGTIEFDEDTSAALQAFQRQMGADPNGMINPETRHLMSQYRCALPDTDPLGALRVGPWNRRNLTYKLGRLSSQLSANEIGAAIRDAFTTWHAVGVGIAFTEVQQESDADIKVEWRPADDPDHSMVGPLVAHSDFPPGFSLIVNAPPLPLHFDDEENRWAIMLAVGAFDVWSIALHEIGHCLGLVHSDDANAIMYPIVQPNVLARVLAPDDLQKLRALYP